LIRYHPFFERQLKKLPRELQRRILARIVEYHETGRGDVRKILGDLEALRVGNYRIYLGWVGDELRVVSVFHRRVVYSKHLLKAALRRLGRE